MSLPNSARSYDDCYKVLDEALVEDRGIRVKMGSMDQALHFRMRCHKARAIDRKNNTQTYEEGHPLHGCSQYDCLVLRHPKIIEETVYLYVERMEIDMASVEPLPNPEEAPKTGTRRV